MKRLVGLAKDIARQRPWLAGVVIAIAVVGFAAAVYLISPLFIRYSVVEESPLGDIGEATVAKDEPMADATVAAEATMAKAASMKMPTVVETPMGEEMDTGPKVLAQGEFNEIDVVHKGEGQAIIATIADGKSILRLENFSVTNGPDLFVYLSVNSDPSSGSEVTTGGYNLGRLKAPEGAFNYEIPADVDPSAYKSVVIYCKAFSVLFSVATLQ